MQHKVCPEHSSRGRLDRSCHRATFLPRKEPACCCSPPSSPISRSGANVVEPISASSRKFEISQRGILLIFAPIAARCFAIFGWKPTARLRTDLRPTQALDGLGRGPSHAVFSAYSKKIAGGPPSAYWLPRRRALCLAHSLIERFAGRAKFSPRLRPSNPHRVRKSHMTRVTRPFTVEIKRSRAASRGSAAPSATPASPAFHETLLHPPGMPAERKRKGAR